MASAIAQHHQKRNTKADYVYEILRHRIIELEIPPGEKLSEERIAAELGVSRSPVKEALTRLAHEDLVCVYPQVGSVVAPISSKKNKDVLEVRLLLEPYAAEKAATRVSEEDLSLLRGLFDDILAETPGTPAYAEKVWRADDVLHAIIRRAADNAEIDRILSSYRDCIHRTRKATASLANRLMPSFSEMKAIFDALERRSPENARKAMEIHIGNINRAFESI